MHELDLAIVGGAIAGAAMQVNGVSNATLNATRSMWQTVETQVRVEIVKTALNEAVHGGKVNWKVFALDIGEDSISDGVDHIITSQCLAGDVERSVMSNALNTMVSDVADHVHDCENVAINMVGAGLGTFAGDETSSMSKSIGLHVKEAWDDKRIKAPVVAQAQALAVNQSLANRQQALDQNGQVLGHELDALGSVPDTSTPQTNPYGNPFFGSPQNLQTRAANQPYGSTVNTPTADVAQPNAAQQKNNQTTARILAQQNAERAQRREEVLAYAKNSSDMLATQAGLHPKHTLIGDATHDYHQEGGGFWSGLDAFNHVMKKG